MNEETLVKRLEIEAFSVFAEGRGAIFCRRAHAEAKILRWGSKVPAASESDPRMTNKGPYNIKALGEGVRAIHEAESHA